MRYIYISIGWTEMAAVLSRVQSLGASQWPMGAIKRALGEHTACWKVHSCSREAEQKGQYLLSRVKYNTNQPSTVHKPLPTQHS